MNKVYCISSYKESQDVRLFHVKWSEGYDRDAVAK